MHLIKRLSWFSSGSSSPKSEHEHGKLVRKFGKKGSRKGQIEMPKGIAVSSEGDIVIADTQNHRVQIFSPEGSLKRKFGEKGLDPDQLCYPMNVIITPGDKSILVTDSANSAVKVFDFRRGKLLHIFEHESEFRMPYGMSLTKDGFLVLTDIYYHKVVVLYVASGILSHSFGSYGNSDSQLDHPYKVITNQNKQIIVSDYGNNSIKIFHFEGKLLRCFNSQDFRLPADDFIQLHDLAVDGDDNTLVACNREVYILTKNGRLWEVLTENDGIMLPLALAVTSAGFIYLVNLTEICVYRYNKDDYRSSKTDEDNNDDDGNDGKDVSSRQTERKCDDDKIEEKEEEEENNEDDDDKEEMRKEKFKIVRKNKKKEDAVEDPSFAMDLSLFYEAMKDEDKKDEHKDDNEKDEKTDKVNEDDDDEKKEGQKLDVAEGGAFPLM